MKTSSVIEEILGVLKCILAFVAYPHVHGYIFMIILAWGISDLVFAFRIAKKEYRQRKAEKEKVAKDNIVVNSRIIGFDE